VRIPFLRFILHSKAVLVYPVPPAPPTAVLQPWFRERGMVRIFPEGWSAVAAAFAPAAIAATWPQLEALLPQHIPSLTHSIIVLATPADLLLTPHQRDRLWRAFRVPVFEQIIGDRGELLAAECEAHDGLHVVGIGKQQPAFATIFPVDTAPCGCGKKSPRLRPQALSASA
jgi:hypothetical protein